MKFLAALGLAMDARERGLLTPETVIYEATSGATGRNLAMIMPSKPFGVKGVTLIMNDDVPLGKKFPALLAGATIISPHQGLSGIATARKLGGGGWKPDGAWAPAEDGGLTLDQYANPANATFYRDRAAPEIARQVGTTRKVVLVAPVGTGGTIVGLSQGLRDRYREVMVVGAMCAPGQEIPGVRDLQHMKEITLPWRDALSAPFEDHRVEVEARPSYSSCLWFAWTQGLTPGISGGLAYVAALKFLKKRKEAGTLDALRDENGKVQIVIVFHDSWSAYLTDRFTAFLPREYQIPALAPKPWEQL
jgi:cysteine synthase